MKKIKIAIIGFGGMAHNHLGRMRECGLFKVVGAYDIDEAMQKDAKRHHLKAFRSVEELFAYKGLQAVLIATPNDVHKEYVIAAAKHGVAALCEKPVTLAPADLEEMLEAHRQAGTVFMVHQNRRWDNDYMVMKKIVEENKLGFVYKLETKVTGSHGIPGAWRKVKSQGGGMIYDWGVHLIDQLMWFDTSKITSVFCRTSYVYKEEVDDGFELTMNFESGRVAVVTIDTNSFIESPRWMIYGMDGTACIPKFNTCYNRKHGRIVCVKERVDKKLKGMQAGNGFTKTMADRSKSTIRKYRLPKIRDDGFALYRNFVQCVREKTPENAVVKGDEVMRVLKVIEAAFISAEKNEVIKTDI